MRDFSSDHRWLSLNTATVRKQGDLTVIVEACARHGIRAIDPWRDQVASVGLDRAVRAVRDAGLELSGYCRGGMFTADAAHRIEVRDDNRRAVDEAKALGAPCIVLVVGGLPQYSRPGSVASKDIAAARTQVHDAIAEMLEYAKAANMPLAIEPLHPAYAADRACVNTTRQALDICDQLDPRRTGALGVALDVYHIWWDPELMPQIARAGKDRLLAFHDRNLLQRLVGKVDGRGFEDLHRTAPDGRLATDRSNRRDRCLNGGRCCLVCELPCARCSDSVARRDSVRFRI
jgi:sugar phosphate isomerase/epimerase